MPKLSVDIESATAAQALTALEKGFYTGFITAEKEQNTKPPSNGTMLGLQVEIDSGPYHGRRLPGGPNQYFFTMTGGRKEDGTPYDVSRFYELINALKAEWICEHCGQPSTKKFVKEKGKYFVPCCGKPVAIKLDESWIGKRANWQVDTEKIPDSDDLRNVIKGARPLD